MRRFFSLNKDWHFQITGKYDERVDVPHTWNAIDGQDGGNDYLRALATYEKTFDAPDFDKDKERVYIQFDGVNSESTVYLNGEKMIRHEGGYSTFRTDITDYLKNVGNILKVNVDNRPNTRVYPQKADFTFYGGIYRDVNLIVVNKNHFDLDYYGGNGVQIKAKPVEGYQKAEGNVKLFVNNIDCCVRLEISDAEGNVIYHSEIDQKTNKLETTDSSNSDVFCLEHSFLIDDVHLWEGVKNPYLYSLKATLVINGEAADEIVTRFGVRDFHYHPKTGFYLNGKSYALHGVSRHQDRKGLGNAITKDMHKEDMDLICEMGANTIRLAHYQHSQYFYDLCDERGMIVWAEIPYISEHMPDGRDNTISQMKELIIQNYNHPSIVCWGISNEITISTRDKKDMMENHRILNDLCHEMDDTRFTTLACYAVCGPFNKVAHITDTVSWNLYLGWYVPGLFLNDIWMRFFHLVYPNRCLGYSEYGCEGMPNLHSEKPKRGDHTEEYQAIYHEYMLRCFDRNPFMWATHVWNMFDFAADARNQGGEPGMNHKGLVTFDRKTKKDSFYLYKAWWSDDPFVHIASKRFAQRTKENIKVKVYSNQNEITLFVDGRKLETKHGQHVFEFSVSLGETGKEHEIVAVSGAFKDSAKFTRVATPNPEYSLKDLGDKGANWT
ncbi:glycoside hydrolase family 2 protein [Butyrivibrio proteoclasticus]|nr:glycoside hydrolase family 2 TIM barrel-domain containing protein [Butyrivibrio proteoclasticus]